MARRLSGRHILDGRNVARQEAKIGADPQRVDGSRRTESETGVLPPSTGEDPKVAILCAGS